MQPDVEGKFGLSALKTTHTTAHTSDEPLTREFREVVAYRDFRDRKLVRKFRNVNAVLGLEERKDSLHPLGACRHRQRAT